MSKLQGKLVVVTGGGRGIGLAIARSCASEGAKLVLVGRHGAVLRQAARQISRDAMAIVADVTRQADVGRAFRRVREKFGRVDILINNAGVFTYKPFMRTTLADWRRNIDTNLTSIFLATRAVLPLLARSLSPHIVNILSISSRDSFANCSAYTASKFGALGLTRVLALELRTRRIRVTAILPGATNTRLIDEFGFPVHRHEIVQPEDVAEAVLAALVTPSRTTLEEIVLTPSKGSLLDSGV
jgi:NAD(P)-dependent dehydrogenase (short-subunit alcohol dehydrogenase family)